MNSESLISKYEKMLSDKDTYSLTGNMDIGGGVWVGVR